MRYVLFLEKPEIGFVVYELSPTYRDLVRTFSYLVQADQNITDIPVQIARPFVSTQ
jgi:hypothetical protein